MTTPPVPPTRPIVRVIRLRALRRHVAVKYLWHYLTREYDLTQPQVIKVRPTAVALGLKKETMRYALRLLVRYRYLDVIVRPTEGTPGEYLAGPRAYRVPTAEMPVPQPRRARRGPPPPTAQLPLALR